MERGFGLMVHITSIESQEGYGCFSKEAYSFVDFLKICGAKYWQVLPINPVDEYNCPYKNSSLRAINPLLISLEKYFDKTKLFEMGFKKGISFEEYSKLKMKALKVLFKKHKISNAEKNFQKSNKNWLEDYALFMALKDVCDCEIRKFPKDILLKKKSTFNLFISENKKIIDFYKFVQYLAFKQWEELKAYANEKGIKIIGDMPFSPDSESDEVFANEKNFQSQNGKLAFVAGVPKDYFNKDGQVWGNPVYDVKTIKENNYKFLLDKFKHFEKLFDYVRVDHFRGYESFYKIPASTLLAKDGKWEKSFGYPLFKILKENKLNNLILEDLGSIDEKVISLKKKTGLPSMRVFQFGFDGNSQNPHLPENYDKNSIAYIGTHDNNTFCGFLSDKKAKEDVKRYFRTESDDDKQLTYLALEAIMASSADVAIIMPQDLLCQGEAYRINTPGKIKTKNWNYKLPRKIFDDNIFSYLISSAKIHNR